MKKGFTLIELLGIIIILGLIMIFTVPNIINSLKNKDDKEYQTFVETITIATETYYQTHTETCDFNTNNNCNIEIQILIDNELIKENLINPKTGTKISKTDVVVLTKNIDGTINYSYSPNVEN